MLTNTKSQINIILKPQSLSESSWAQYLNGRKLLFTFIGNGNSIISVIQRIFQEYLIINVLLNLLNKLGRRDKM